MIASARIWEEKCAPAELSCDESDRRRSAYANHHSAGYPREITGTLSKFFEVVGDRTPDNYMSCAWVVVRPSPLASAKMMAAKLSAVAQPSSLFLSSSIHSPYDAYVIESRPSTPASCIIAVLHTSVKSSVYRCWDEPSFRSYSIT